MLETLGYYSMLLRITWKKGTGLWYSGERITEEVQTLKRMESEHRKGLRLLVGSGTLVLLRMKGREFG